MGLYSYQTYDTILARMLARSEVQGLDTREGSIVYIAASLAAVELAQNYDAMNIFFEQTFADTATTQYLMRRAAERGLSRNPATASVVHGSFTPTTLDLLGQRFTCGGVAFLATQRISDGEYRMECETAGEVGNISSGTLVPIGGIPGLETAAITSIIVPGEDEESTEDLRTRYFASLNPVAFGGNVADYKAKVDAIQGVGGVKVYPVWNGSGTVKISFISSDYGAPSPEQIAEVQTAIDPTQNAGEGLGIAPIGHVVTVAGVSEVSLDIGLTITYSSGFTWDSISASVEDTIDSYFLELAQAWADNDYLTVRMSQIEIRVLNINGVLDISGVTIAGASSNYVMGADEIPIRGAVSG